jgi:GT2 family glycosyltransferase/glycosyltransferase involved in cell wall biosynthesis
MLPIRAVYGLSYQTVFLVVIKLYRKVFLKRLEIRSKLLQNRQSEKLLKMFIQAVAISLIPFFILIMFSFSLRDFGLKKTRKDYALRTTIDNSLKSFVLFAPVDWDFRKQRPQNIAKNLNQTGSEVFYINPTMKFHLKRRINLVVKNIEGINVVTFYSRHYRTSDYIGVKPIPNRLGEEFAYAIEQMLASSANFSTVITIQQPGWWPVVRHLVGNQIVFDCMDLHNGFDSISADIDNLEDQIDLIADQVIVTSQYLQSIKGKGFANKTTCIRNAVEFSHFPFLDRQLDNKEVVVGYFGAIAEWFDFDLIAEIARNNPEIRFEIIGRVSDSRVAKALDSFSNILFLGEIPSAVLPSRIVNWNAGLIPFRLSPLILATNPVKMYEYAASGIPVVATDIPEVRSIAETTTGVYVASTPATFQENLESAIQLSESDRKSLRRWAEGQTWKQRTEQILQVIEKSPKVSIIVLMWNHSLLTINCLSSIYERSDYKNLEVILVDNGSDLKESEIVSKWIENHKSNQTVYIKNEVNLGFAAGNNVGLKVATGDFIVVLNNDTEVTPGWIWRSIKHFAKNPKLGLLGPSTNNCGNEARVVLRNGEGNWLQEVIPRFGLRQLRAFPATTLAFFCVFISREVLDKIGLISEDFGKGFFEDDDYCRRVEAAGYEISIARDIFVHHQMSASFDLLGDSVKRELFETNKAIYESKWGKWVPHSYTIDEDQR